MYINFNDKDIQYLWELEYHEINKAQLDQVKNLLEKNILINEL